MSDARRSWGSAHDELKEKLSGEAFAELVRLFGGRRLRIPLEIRETQRERADRVQRELRTRTYRETAAVCDLPLRSVVRAAGR